MKDKETPLPAKGAKLTVHVKPAPSASESASQATLLPSSLQLKRILVPIDFSESSEKALRYALRFAEQFGSSITLLHVIQPMVYPADFGYPPTVLDTLDDTVRRQIQERLGRLASGISGKVKHLIRLGQPYHEITTTAKELDMDLIIISTHGRTGLKHVLMGSTAERVLRHAPCPVLTVREREHDFV
jgi:universal stress protein A